MDETFYTLVLVGIIGFSIPFILKICRKEIERCVKEYLKENADI